MEHHHDNKYIYMSIDFIYAIQLRYAVFLCMKNYGRSFATSVIPMGNTFNSWVQDTQFTGESPRHLQPVLKYHNAHMYICHNGYIPGLLLCSSCLGTGILQNSALDGHPGRLIGFQMKMGAKFYAK